MALLDEQIPEPASPGPTLEPPAVKTPAATMPERDMSTTTVAGNLEGLLQKDSPYFDVAETDAKKRMNERGLLNSSMTVGAMEDARIRSALPIAAQDASAGMSDYLSTKGHEQTKELADKSFGQNYELAEQSFEHSSDLSEQSHEQRLDEVTHGVNENVRQMIAATNEQLRQAGPEMSGNLQGMFVQHISSIQSNATASISNIMTQPNIEAADKNAMIRDIQAQRDADLQLISSIYGQMPAWQSSWTLLGNPEIPPSVPIGENVNIEVPENVTPPPPIKPAGADQAGVTPTSPAPTTGAPAPAPAPTTTTVTPTTAPKTEEEKLLTGSGTP